MMDSGNRACARAIRSRTRASAPTRSRRSENIPREALDDLSLESQQRADRAIRNGYFDQEPRAGAPRGRHARARPRGISAPAHDARRPRRAEARVPGDGRLRRSTRAARPIASSSRRSIPTSTSRTCTTPATRPAWSTAPRRCCSPRRTTRSARAEAAREGRRDGQHGRQPDADAQRAGPGGAQGARQGGPDARRHRPVRDQRGVRGRGGEIHPRPEARPRRR